MTSEWRDIDFADADISLLGVTKITDVGYCFLLVAVLTVSTGIVFPCVLCLFRQVQASSDSSLLYYELFSLYGHIPRRCSSSSLIIVSLCPPRVLIPSILPSKTVCKRDSLFNTWPNQFVCLSRMVFIKLLFSSSMSKTSRLDQCSVQLIFSNVNKCSHTWLKLDNENIGGHLTPLHIIMSCL